MAMVLYNLATGNTNLEDDLKLMRTKAETVFARAADISIQVRNAELHPGKKRKREVDNWMKQAQELKIKMESIEGEVEQDVLSNRRRLKNQILKITKEMEELLQQAVFHNGLMIRDLASSSLPLVTTNMKGQQFEKKLRMILSWLMNDEVSIIGVYGVGGVGKTTMATHVHNQLLNLEGKHANVYWVTVSQECTVSKLQDKIAKELNLSTDTLTEADEMKRPAILLEAFKKRSNVIVILDDVWEYFPMERIGLPIGKSRCKLLLTTRSLEVCRRTCQVSVKVEVLSEDESLSLFSEMLGNYEALSNEAQDIAKLVVKECAGLPLGIKIVATSMRGVFDVYEWKNTLEELTNPARIHVEMESGVFRSLQLSYSRLNDVMLQNCFLSCAFYPEDSELMRDNLVNLWIMEGHLEEIQSRQEQLNKTYTMLNRLISVCLLEATDQTGNCVKMHDLIRDMAISRQRNNAMIKAGMQLRVVPRLQEWTEKLTKVSLVSNNIREIPSGISPECPNLLGLLLADNPLENIPDSFFLFLNGLELLDLTRTSIERVPNCISYLENLSALKFTSCSRLVYVPSLEKLTKLRYLCLSRCQEIKILPDGMNKLVNLQCLLLTGSDNLCVPFSELTLGLSNIQCLELSCGVRNTEIRDIQKLGFLERLTGCQIRDTSNFNSYTKSQHLLQLTSYQLILGEACRGSFHCFYDRNIIIEDIKFEGEAGAVPAHLPHNIQELRVLSSDFRVRSFVDALPSLDGLTKLTRIFIFQCQGMESIWSESSCSKPTLGNLEQLIISDNHSFRALAIGRVELQPGTLSNLRKLKVEYCSTVEKLFTPCMLKGQLRNLEEIDIQVCVGLEEIFAGSDVDAESGDATSVIAVELPKLRVLSLTYLQRLVSICKIGLVSCKSIEEISVINCPKLKNLPLVLELHGNGKPTAPPGLQRIHVERDWWESLVSHNPNFKHTLQPFVQFCKLSSD